MPPPIAVQWTVVPILAYHQVDLSHQAAVVSPGLVVDARSFSRQMALVHGLGYKSIDLSSLVAGLEGKLSLPRRPLVLTFDDGYSGTFRCAFPVLQRHRLVGTMFLIAEDFEHSGATVAARAFPVMTRAEVGILLSAGFQLGSHSLTHPRLPDLSLAGAKGEISESKTILEQVFGRPVTAFCYPYGALCHRLEEQVAEAGYESAVGTAFGNRHRIVDRFALKRISVPGTHSLALFLYRLLWAARSQIHSQGEPR